MQKVCIFAGEMSKKITYISADEAVSVIRSHQHIHLGGVANVPAVLVEALVRAADAGQFHDLHFHHIHTEGSAPYGSRDYEGIFFDQGFFVGANVRSSVNAGYADYIPVHLEETPEMYRSGALPCDVALIQVSEPNASGHVSLGTSVDCTKAAIECAKTVIAVVNPCVPFAYGDLITVDDIDIFVRDNRALPTVEFPEPSALDMAIGRNCAELIQDGACLQMGIGSLPTAITRHLGNHKNIGIHSELFSEGVVDLVEKGVINGSLKAIDRGKIVASFLLGGKRLYDFIDHNKDVQMRDISYTNDPWIIARNPNVVSINFATEIDLTGQICADSIGTRIYSGTGGQLDFVKGARRSPGGKSIIAMPSRTKNGKSKLVPILTPGAGVVTPRADAQWIVTEYGAANLYGKSLQERAQLLINIAHPDDREALDMAAFERFGPHYKAVYSNITDNRVPVYVKK